MSARSQKILEELVAPLQRDLERVLAGLPKEAIERFALECFGCIGEHLILDKDFRESERADAIRRLQLNVRAAGRLLGDDPTSWGKFSPRAHPVEIRGDTGFYELLYAPLMDDSRYSRYWHALRQYQAAAAALATELRGIEPPAQRRRGRPKADARGILAKLARRYLEIFNERPSTTPGGRFSNVAVLILRELQDAPAEDVSRHVSAAVRAI
jgi:hypothetical protein